MSELNPAFTHRRVWQVGALCRAVADLLDVKLNPVTIQGEVSGFSRASSGHCYFSLKDATGQLRCAMFRRSASLLDFKVSDGELVEVRGRVGVYEPRGDLQLVVESMSRTGQGALFERFVQLKNKLEAEGLFSPFRKRALPAMPRAIGVVTSLGAAALHDVISTLERRAPHIPVVIAAATVQGAGAPAELVAALAQMYRLAESGDGHKQRPGNRPAAQVGTGVVWRDPIVDVVLLVRGGGSIEDLWAFNDEGVARAVGRSPVPVVTGVGHETDFTIADFCADLRAPTPTAAAELVAQPREALLSSVNQLQARLGSAVMRRLDVQAQWLDAAESKLGRPSARAVAQQLRLAALRQQLRHVLQLDLQRRQFLLRALARRWATGLGQATAGPRQGLERLDLRLRPLDPKLVLQRGYAWLAGIDGRAITTPSQAHIGQEVRAVLSGGTLELLVTKAG